MGALTRCRRFRKPRSGTGHRNFATQPSAQIVFTATPTTESGFPICVEIPVQAAFEQRWKRSRDPDLRGIVFAAGLDERDGHVGILRQPRRHNTSR